MQGEWCYYTGFLSSDECSQIVSSSSELNLAKIGTDTEGTVQEYHRRSKIAWLDKIRFKWLYDKVWCAAVEANREFFGFHIDDVENFQLTEYSADYFGEYKEHVDITWLSKRHRKLSCVIQLSNPAEYSGGALMLKADQVPSEEAIRMQGSAIFFPSFLPHQVTPVYSGTRYSLVAWFGGPSFR